MGTRQRQVKLNQPPEPTNSKTSPTGKPSRRQKSSNMKYYLVALTLSVLGFTYIYRANVGKVVDDIATKFDITTPTYAIVLDAGSTASRLNLLTFHNSVVDGQLVLDDTLFLETKPGLSAFAKNPKDVEKSLNILLDKAKSTIPRSQWASTPMSLRATAGLRLLPENEAQAILDESKRVLASSGFKVTENSVTIMDGTDEGIFSWITTNYLLGKFDNLDNSVAALDLGGGSNQVTFSIAPDALPKRSPHWKNIHHVSALGKNISVFTDSYLGMGLNAAKEKIITHPDNPRKKGSKDLEVTSECVSPTVSGVKWNYGGKTYVVSGSERNDVDGSIDFDKCVGIIKKIVLSAIPHDLPGLKEHDIYAFSYYFERAEESGLIDPVTGGIVSVGDLRKQASKVCENPSANTPFMCLDLSFIYVLLHNGFGLDNTSNVFLRKYINGHQLNWALGAAFELLQNDM